MCSKSGLLATLASTLLVAVMVVPSPAAAQRADWPSPIHDDQIFWKVLAEQIELAASETREVAFEVQGWVGTDYDRLWVKAEGERATGASAGDFEVQALYSRLFSAYFDFQAGVRYDRQLGPGDSLQRAHLVVGFEGLAPYWFEVEPAVFISEEGDVSARIEASYDLLMTQRLILQPDLEVNLAVQSVEEWGVGGGLADLSLAVRLRYEVRREVAPYVGVEWFQRFGETADLAEADGEETGRWALLGGVRVWF